MECDIERELMSGRKFVPPEQAPHDNQVTRTGDRDEFCQSLNDGKNNGLIDGQGLFRVSEGWDSLLNVKDQRLRPQGPIALRVVCNDSLRQFQRAIF